MAPKSKAWRCTVCGYVHHGDQPPPECPVCGATRAEFEPYVEESVPAPAAAPALCWRCLQCQHIHAADGPPPVCPVCGATASGFEPATVEADEVVGASGGHILILGAGIAGVSAAEAVRKASPDARITLLSRETDLPYYRLNLTRYLAGQVDEHALPIHPSDWYAANAIELLCGAEVAQIQPDRRTVLLRGGKPLTYDRLILTAGAHPFMPPLPGGQREGVRTVRSLQDVRWIVDHLQPGMKCACIGGGVLGVETAAALAARGADVTLLEGHGWLMPRQLSRAAAGPLQTHVEQAGVRLRTRARTKEILGDERVGGVLLEDGTTLLADLVIMTTGVRPNSFLARCAGLAMGMGVIVDNRLFTSHPDILAAGDVAEHRGVVYGTWSPAQFMGSIAGLNAVARGTEFGGIPRSNTLKVLGVDLLSIGRFEPEDASYQMIEQETDGGYMRFVFRDGRLVGAILLGEGAISAIVARRIAEGTDMSALLAGRPGAKDVFAHLAGHGSLS